MAGQRGESERSRVELTLLDPLANALSTISNNERRHKRECLVWPASKLMGQVLRVMQKNGYLGEFEYIDDGRSGKFRVQLLGRINSCAVVKPRYSVKSDRIEEWEKRFLPSREVGLLIMSSPGEVISQRDAKERKVGGRLLAYVY